MDDKRFKDENSNSFSINDDYEELLKSVDSYLDFENDYIELSDGTGDEYEDIFSNSDGDVYISRRDNHKPEADDVYITKRRNRDIYTDVYSETPSVSSRNTARRAPASQSDINPRPRTPGYNSVPPRKANDRFNTQEVEKKEIFDDDISDHDARLGRRTSESNKKKSKAPKVLISLLVIVLAVVVGFGGILFVAANSIVGEFIEAEPIEHIEDVDSLVSESHVRNILLIGADKEKGGASRSDSIMIASVNKQTGKITVVSILRDTHVDVPGHRESKINAAYAWGGANLLIQTIEQNFGIKIDDYATVDFEMFTALIDGLGGIDVEVTEDEADYINNRHKYGSEEKPETVPSGDNVHLTGYQALWYARIRKLDSDFNRTERQRKVIGAIVEKTKDSLNPVGIFGLVSTAKDVAPYIETTLSTTDFWSLVLSLSSCMTKSGADMDKMFVSAQLPFEDTWWFSSQWDGSSISVDFEENRQLLYELLYEDAVEESTEETTED